MRVVRISLDDLTSDLDAALSYWNTTRGNRLAPAWADIDMMMLPLSLIPMTLVVDVGDPIETSKFRFWGSELTRIHGVEMTGKSPYSIDPPEFGRQLLFDHTEIVKNQTPAAWHYSFPTPQGFTHSHSILRLPIMTGGKKVSQIVAVADYSREALERMHRTGQPYEQVFGKETPG